MSDDKVEEVKEIKPSSRKKELQPPDRMTPEFIASLKRAHELKVAEHLASLEGGK